ncbi:PQ-loop-domain-containing protein [Halteromyces radiatus]|uniref:PQ-loop-domain-containing protein n=1 Tax=Halteromyces radiatus TaxID=101107 RepID=UPI0022202544|nr:PQ-loop-domain-containing protein [Halteromyces radiatus]KAI8098485.1 PQ-loop-domain-containing protein [Halteromyces radiatus]
MNSLTIYSGNTWPVISNIIGWGYFLSWSASFYPQAILNFRRKSVQGLSLDFLYYNLFGFICYSVFNLAFFFSDEIQDEYRRRHQNSDNLVRANDVLFAVHALLISSITLAQTFIYKSNQKLSITASYLLLAFLVSSLVAVGCALLNSILWIDVLYYLSYIKLFITFIKYLPQVWLNYSRRSTVGWSIYNILLDLNGGILSVAQLVLDAAISGDWSGITGDPVKFGLGFVAIAFDLIFIVQHYVLYRERYDIYLDAYDEERQQLIPATSI